MVYSLFRALPGDRAFLPPSPPRSLLLKNLTPASRRQDHTASPSVSAPFVIGTSTSTAPRPASVTIASRPFGWDETAAINEVIWVRGKGNIFGEGGLTGESVSGAVRIYRYCSAQRKRARTKC